MTVSSMHKLKKPLYLILDKGRSLEGEALRQEAETKYRHVNMASFSSFGSAAKVLRNMSLYHDFLESQGYQIPTFQFAAN